MHSYYPYFNLKNTSSLLPVSATSSCSIVTSNPASNCSIDHERKEKRESGSRNHNVDLGPVPSQFDVENAIASLCNFVQGISENVLTLYRDQRIMQSDGYRIVHDAFQWLQTDSSFKRLVLSLCTDKAVWDAVVNNELIANKLQQLPFLAGGNGRRPADESEKDKPDLATFMLRWILDITRAKIMELVNKFVSLVNTTLHLPRDEKPKSENKEVFLEEKIRSSLLLSLIILLIVVVSRVQGA